MRVKVPGGSFESTLNPSSPVSSVQFAPEPNEQFLSKENFIIFTLIIGIVMIPIMWKLGLFNKTSNWITAILKFVVFWGSLFIFGYLLMYSETEMRALAVLAALGTFAWTMANIIYKEKFKNA